MRLLFCLMTVGLCAAPPAEVYANVLYWRPTYDGVTYAIVGILNVADDAAVVGPNNHVGYEVGGRAQLCSPALYLAGRYLAFDTSPAKQSVLPQGGTSLLPMFAGATFFGGINFAEGVISSHYRTADLELGWTWNVPYVTGGLRYFNCTERERYIYIETAVGNPVLLALQQYSWRGWGPRLAVGTLFRCWQLGLRTQVGFTAAIANRRLKINAGSITTVTLGQQSVLYPEERAINMAFDFTVELQGSIYLSGVQVAGRLGYELDTYLNGRTRVDTTNVVIVADRSSSALGYGGPYIGVSIGY